MQSEQSVRGKRRLQIIRKKAKGEIITKKANTVFDGQVGCWACEIRQKPAPIITRLL